MFTFIKQNRILSVVVVVFVFVIAFYTFFMGSSGSTGNATLLDTTGANSAASQQLLVTLANLHTIRLDSNIFNDPVFLSLTDFGVVISPESVGRRNPFAPFTATSSPTANGNTRINTVTPTPVSGTIPGTNPPTPRVRVFPVQ
jgi:hypothetical protein